VVVDLSEAEFIDSSVIGALLHGQKLATAQGMPIVLQLGTAAVVERVIGLTRITDVIPRVSSRQDALAFVESALGRDPSSRRFPTE
jgi:anti-anti-sigma regulatory factor